MESKAKPEAKSEQPKELELVANLRADIKGLTPHDKRVALTHEIRKYAGDFQSVEYVQLNLLAQEVGVVF